MFTCPSNSINPLITMWLTLIMIVKLIFIVLLVVGLFGVSLLISYEGFQSNPSLRTQQMPLNEVLSNCSKMDSILTSNDLTYEQIIRLINNNEINSQFNSNEIKKNMNVSKTKIANSKRNYNH